MQLVVLPPVGSLPPAATRSLPPGAKFKFSGACVYTVTTSTKFTTSRGPQRSLILTIEAMWSGTQYKEDKPAVRRFML